MNQRRLSVLRGFTTRKEVRAHAAGMHMHRMTKEQNPKGFTLVETLVAITVIATALVGPLYAVQQALNASRTAREQLVASSLAQEGVEHVRWLRDSNYLFVFSTGASRSWLFGVDGTGGSPNCITAPCTVDSTQALYSGITRTTAPPPLRLSATGLYNQAPASATNVATIYTRTAQLFDVPGTLTEKRLVVTVTWTTKGQTRNVTITEYLHNWL